MCVYTCACWECVWKRNGTTKQTFRPPPPPLRPPPPLFGSSRKCLKQTVLWLFDSSNRWFPAEQVSLLICPLPHFLQGNGLFPEGIMFKGVHAIWRQSRAADVILSLNAARELGILYAHLRMRQTADILVYIFSNPLRNMFFCIRSLCSVLHMKVLDQDSCYIYTQHSCCSLYVLLVFHQNELIQFV